MISRRENQYAASTARDIGGLTSHIVVQIAARAAPLLGATNMDPRGER